MSHTTFRLWDKRLSSMPFTGFHLMGETMLFQEVERYIDENRCGLTTLERLADMVVTEAIGLPDFNGSPIYDGDILEVTGECDITGTPGRVKLAKGMRYLVTPKECYYIISKGTKRCKRRHLSGLLVHQNGLVVVGNQFETPQLMNKNV